MHFTEAADADLEAIASYTIARFGLEQARLYRDGLFKVFDLISEFPQSGSEQVRLRPKLRRLVHDAHAIYYEIRDEDILVVRILGRGQDPLSSFEDD
ncbi:MAG: type II toxin-antitoxin system RelE/ParE family toxin [Candidatus Hydrogenedentes bacterium]|nr:type II toxin-antitoxin system RelE/ParE family toxin [Candidatus Hydrogenedentota bacterium]